MGIRETDRPCGCRHGLLEHSLCRGGKASDSGQREQFHAAPLEGGQMPEPCLPGQFSCPLEIPPYILRPVSV